jgi:DNA-binding transcriptional LysR family regulator
MNLADLEAFVALAETGSIKRAALHLGLTQPATTRRVQNFEARMGGARLLDRSVKPAVLTQAGRDVLNRCQRILRAVADLDEFASGKSTPIELRIGVSPGLAATVFSSPFDELRRRFASLQLRIKSQLTGETIEAIQANALDCAVALLCEHHRLPSGIVSAQIGIEPLAVVASRDLTLPTFSNRSPRLKDLGDAGWFSILLAAAVATLSCAPVTAPAWPARSWRMCWDTISSWRWLQKERRLVWFLAG